MDKVVLTLFQIVPFAFLYLAVQKGDIKIRDRAEFSLLKALREGKKKALAGAFDWYYMDLVLFAGNYIRNLPQCEDIVQNVFIRFMGGTGWFAHRIIFEVLFNPGCPECVSGSYPPAEIRAERFFLFSSFFGFCETR